MALRKGVLSTKTLDMAINAPLFCYIADVENLRDFLQNMLCVCVK